MKKPEINSTEIAKLAGVSRSTVSRVINNYSNVPAETREKVLKVIQQYNYFPNVSAQVLAGKRARTIGLFLIEQGNVSGDMLTNMLIVSVIEHASEHGYYVLTHIIRDAKDTEMIKNVKEIFFQRRIDGGIFIGAAIHEPFIEELVDEGFVIGIVDQTLSDHPEPNRIVSKFNNDSGMKQAVAYLAGLGHTSIGVINGDMNRLSGQTKYEGYKTAMRMCGLQVNPNWVLNGNDFHESSGYKAIQKLMSQETDLPTAIIAANDSVAFGAIRALKEHKLRVPEDLSMIGFDDHALSEKHHPALTTIRVDFSDMLKRMTSCLITKIEQKTTDIKEITVDCSLVVRESCRRI
ncbi:LacI family DNA-binding transcriptional regulator [Paenibacillus sp. CGMCC 1.16610]|uniref:LacI family DNA-binding transcriptional regulator n=1 Tax=Paenibacillus anseongense TaxID=2682845 RepID=A0ABW9UG15_9BACL|nr:MULTISPECIES: LacI family DNA-binding transcriptional regulator [Paenibacillus]MBA2939428.1 LacI family DNA-binding transcriptional regulator [Paenibacillus sp. CGMCC 1.16610]MVQ39092.1 LacI family DNA-binding transcriptional regulator [Paenibacillus anseongense]